MQIGEDSKEKKVKMAIRSKRRGRRRGRRSRDVKGQVRFSRERNAQYSTLLSIYSILNPT